MPTCRTDETAVTLLEVVVVLAVLALAVGLVLPRAADVSVLAVDAAASELAATINLTRQRAILGARPLTLALELDAGRWTVSGTDTPPERGALPERVRLRRVVSGDASRRTGVAMLAFDPAGDSLPVRVELSDDHGHAATVLVPPASGRAVVQR